MELRPRRAKLIVRDIRGNLVLEELFKAGFLGEALFVDTGLLGAGSGMSICRDAERVLSFSLRRDIDLAEILSCALDAFTSGSLGRLIFDGFRRCRRFLKG